MLADKFIIVQIKKKAMALCCTKRNLQSNFGLVWKSVLKNYNLKGSINFLYWKTIVYNNYKFIIFCYSLIIIFWLIQDPTAAILLLNSNVTHCLSAVEPKIC